MPLEVLAADETLATVLDNTFVRPPAFCASSAAAPASVDSAAIRGIVQPGRRDVVIHSTLEFAITNSGDLATAGFFGQVRHRHRDGGTCPIRRPASAMRDGAEGSITT
jgi:hypothetical protein